MFFSLSLFQPQRSVSRLGHSPEASQEMMDCSEEVQLVSEEPSAQMELKKGMSIFIDVSIQTDVFNFKSVKLQQF